MKSPNTVSRGPGRPKLPDDERRSIKVQLRLTTAERDRLTAIENKLNMSSADAVRYLINKVRLAS